MASSTSVGPLPGNWLAAHIADLTPDLHTIFLAVLTLWRPMKFSIKLDHTVKSGWFIVYFVGSQVIIS